MKTVHSADDLKRTQLVLQGARGGFLSRDAAGVRQQLGLMHVVTVPGKGSVPHLSHVATKLSIPLGIYNDI